MSISHIQDLAVTGSTGGGSSLQSGTAFGATPTNGNTILVFIWTEDGAGSGAVTGVSDNVAGSPNTYVSDGVSADASGAIDRATIYRCSNVVGGAGFKITVNTTGNAFITFCAAEFSGLSVSSPLDGSGSTNSGHATTNQPSTGAFSTTNANDLIVISSCSASTSAATPPGSFNSIDSSLTNGTHEDGNAAYQIVSAVQSSINPTWSAFTTGDWAAIGLAYKAGDLGPSGRIFKRNIRPRTFAPGIAR